MATTWKWGVRITPWAVFAAALAPAPALAQDPGALPAPAEAAWPRTAAEESGWARNTSYPEVLDFLARVSAASPHVESRRLALTPEGRLVPVVFVGDPPHDDPVESRASGKSTILILGSAHGNEPSGKEASLQLIRELALGEASELLTRVNLIVVPYMNPDGGEAGVRESAGYDLNRDWIVAETPEVASILDRLVNRFKPDVFVDVHNGGAFPYHLTYQATLDPAADADLVGLARGPIYEFVRAALESKGMGMYWYSGPTYDEQTARWSWGTTEAWPRKQHSYGGLRNMIALLYEVPGDHPPEVGASAALQGLLALTQFVAENGTTVREVVQTASRRAIEEPADLVFLELAATPYPEVEEFFVPRRQGGSTDSTPTLVRGENRTLFVPTRSRPAPWGYVLSPQLGDVAHLLRRHGVEVEIVTTAAEVAGERYRVQQVVWEQVSYQHHFLADVGVELEPGTIALPVGSYLVRVAQAEGRLVPQLLEPDAVDSVVRWNLLDSVLGTLPEQNFTLPIYRLMTPAALVTTPVQ